VIDATGGGLVFPEGDAVALAASIGELHADESRRRMLAARGLEGVWRQFAPPAAARELDALIRSALPVLEDQ